MDIAVFIIIWVLFAIAAAFIASTKGKDAGSWFLLGLVFGIFAVIVVALGEKKPTTYIVLVVVLFVGLFVYSQMWMSNLEERAKEATYELKVLKAQEARRAAEKFQQDFADSLQRVENQKKLEEYLKRHPSERAKVRKN